MAIRDPRIGTLVGGRFRVESVLGEGQMARVYLAEQLSMKRKVALKIIRPELTRHPSAPMRFRREVEAVTRLHSPHAIVFYDFADEGNSLYIAMELLDGETLRARLDRDIVIPPPIAAAIVRQIATCLDEAHAVGVLHRDLKPENIFLCNKPGPDDIAPFVKVLDFGLAKLTEPIADEGMFVTAASVTVGTPAYLAPEMAVLGRRADARADLYALGVMTFEMIVGARPYLEQTPSAMIQAHVRAPIPLPSVRRPGLRNALDHFMLTALAKAPHERFDSGAALAYALDLAVG
jgi:serine/threonine-protein kinase